MTTYEKRKQDGLCVRCGLVPPEDTKTLCLGCKVVYKGYYEKGKADPDYIKKRREESRTWRENNRAYANKRDRTYIKELRNEVFNHYGGACTCCGETCFVFLTLDHVNNDGKEDRQRAGSTNFYRYIRAQGYPTTVQLLCHSCNQAKRILGYCPHHPDHPRHHVWVSLHCVNCEEVKTELSIRTPCTAPVEFEFRGERVDNRSSRQEIKI